MTNRRHGNFRLHGSKMTARRAWIAQMERDKKPTITALRPCIGDEWQFAVVYNNRELDLPSASVLMICDGTTFMGSDAS